MVTDRYFYKTDSANDIKAIYRLHEDSEKKKVTELVWLGNRWNITVWLDNRWNITDNLVQMIVNGEFYLDEVTRDTVQHFTPYVDTSDYVTE
jgi:hypothetical protein